MLESELDKIISKPSTVDPMFKIPYDRGSCESCGWKGDVSKCYTDTVSEGWEYPQYTVHLCPKCDDGTIADYWYSDKMLKKHLGKDWNK